MRFHFLPWLRCGLVAFIGAAMLSSCGPPDSKSSRFVVAEGKGVKITRGDMDAYRARFSKLREVQLDQLPPSKQAQIAQKCVVEQLLLQEAGSLDQQAISLKVEARMAELRARVPSEENFQALLLRLKTTKEQIKKELTQEILIEELLKTKFPPPGSPPTAVVEKYYRDHPDEWNLPPTVRVSHVLVFVPREADVITKAAKRKMIEVARERVKKENFEKVAKEVSEDKASAARGGDLGLLVHGKMPQTFEKMALQTSVGEVSPVFETPQGFDFLKVTEKKAGSKLGLDQAREIIVKKLTDWERQKGIHEYVGRMIKDAHVVYHLNASDAGPRQAGAYTP